MANNSQFADDGALQWKSQINISSENTLSINSTLFPNLTDCNVMSDTDISFKIEKTGNILIHLFIDSVVSWEVVEQQIFLITKDKVVYTLIFLSTDMALAADDKINRILNGEIITAC